MTMADRPLRIPQTYTWIQWPSRRNGPVRIHSCLRLALDHSVLSTYIEGPLTFRKLRRYFRRRASTQGDPVQVSTKVIGIPLKLQFERDELRRLLRRERPRSFIPDSDLPDLVQQLPEGEAPGWVRSMRYRDALMAITRSTYVEDELLRDWALLIAYTLSWYGHAQYRTMMAGQIRRAIPRMSKERREALRRQMDEELGRRRHQQDEHIGLDIQPDSRESRFRWSLQVLKTIYCGVPFTLTLPPVGPPILGSSHSNRTGI
jgi:hypothetical protein